MIYFLNKNYKECNLYINDINTYPVNDFINLGDNVDEEIFNKEYKDFTLSDFKSIISLSERIDLKNVLYIPYTKNIVDDKIEIVIDDIESKLDSTIELYTLFVDLEDPNWGIMEQYIDTIEVKKVRKKFKFTIDNDNTLFMIKGMDFDKFIVLYNEKVNE